MVISNYGVIMPIFEYKCNNCNKNFEILIKSGKEKNIKCSYCNSDSVTKKISVFSVNTVSASMPECSSGCTGGYEKGSCGSGMCGGMH